MFQKSCWEAVQAKLAASRPGAGYVRSGSEPSILTGLVFDETGDRLSPSHAVKAGRRYRYYVSRRLAREPNTRGDGWRLPARELERAVVSALTSYLHDQSRLITDLQLGDRYRPDQLSTMLHRACTLGDEIAAAAPGTRRHLLERMLRRIELSPGQMQSLIRREGF